MTYARTHPLCTNSPARRQLPLRGEKLRPPAQAEVRSCIALAAARIVPDQVERAVLVRRHNAARAPGAVRGVESRQIALQLQGFLLRKSKMY